MTLVPLAVAGGVGVAALGWGVAEAHSFAVRRVTVPVLPQGARAIRVLHLSDLHLAPGQRAKARWVASLMQEQPDLVVNTGDNLAHATSVPLVLGALDGLLDVPGVFVHGSNDYFAPHFKNPFGYFRGPSRVKHTPDRLPTRALTTGFESRGWLNLNNARGAMEIHGVRLSFVGVDDPHVGRDEMPERASATAGDVHLGVMHAPYRRILEDFARDGAALTFAGHTHGGQVCLPGWGALVTNCDLDTRRAKGLHRWTAEDRADFAASSDGDMRGGPGAADDMWFNVSAGVGTSPYVRLRYACRPEATLLTLVPGGDA